MLLVDRSLHRIRAYAAASRLDAEAFARLAQVPGSTARRLLRGRGNPTYRLIAALESVVPDDFVAPSEDARAGAATDRGGT